jgi:secondary thiamine-phosphate synthase enzyme
MHFRNIPHGVPPALATLAVAAILSLMELEFSTQGFNQILDITVEVARAVAKAGVRQGVAHLFVNGSTAALTTIEFEPGAVKDLQRALDQIAPMDVPYAHNEAWGDGNGYAHLRAALLKPDLCVPIESGKLALGAWQQIILMDFDNRPRERKVRLTITAAA